MSPISTGFDTASPEKEGLASGGGRWQQGPPLGEHKRCPDQYSSLQQHRIIQLITMHEMNQKPRSDLNLN